MSIRPLPASQPSFRELFTPKLVTAFKEGYRLEYLRADAIAGLTVAIVALPLAMAIAIASGAPPETGLITAIVAGLLISALGGSRYQIGGPTAAFIVVVFGVIQREGYDGLVTATLMAGLILVALGLLRLGTYIKYIPYPVVTGFTSGIAASIFISQIKELLGLSTALPAEFFGKIEALVAALPETNLAAVGIALLSLAILIVLRRYRPRWPGFLIAVVIASAVVALLHLDAPTIATRFGGVPNHLPAPHLPVFDLDRIRALVPDALTIALLAGIESLLSAVVADGMTGRRHRSNVELVGQGVANIASSLFGGLPATGAIARTATNIRAGARTPVSGMLHAVFLFLFMIVGAPILGYVPLAALGAILTLVAWNISEISHMRRILGGATMGDRVVLVVTFVLTVVVDLTVAIEVGVVLAAFLFMHRMADAVEIQTEHRIIQEDQADGAPRESPPLDQIASPPGTVVYRINGPFFFGASQKFSSTLDRIGAAPKQYVLDFSAVPFVDSTGATALKSFVDLARRHRAEVIVAAASATVRAELAAFHVDGGTISFAESVEAALGTRPAAPGGRTVSAPGPA